MALAAEAAAEAAATEGDNMSHLFFDLDGTLVNNGEGIVKSVFYALDYLGVYDGDADGLQRFIGPPLSESFRTFYRLNDTAVATAVEKYRERYTKKGIFECALYDGIEDLLKALRAHGHILCVASSKPEVFVLDILKNLNIYPYFTCVAGASLDNSLVEKKDVIEKVIAALSLTDRSEIYMIGDRKYDIEGARISGTKSIAVEYGFAPKDELSAAQPDYLVKDIPELKALLLKL